MKIEKINSIKETKKSNSFLSEIVSQIFAICKEDPSFDNQGKLDMIDNQLKEVKEKINRQNKLLDKSKEIKKKLDERLNILDNSLTIKREELLESLGSEL